MKYIASLDYLDKSLVFFLSAVTGSISIESFATVGASVEIASVSFRLAFEISTIIVKKFLKTTR